MNALILADIEGIIGINDLDDREKCKTLYTKEIEVYINALLKNGVKKIILCDAHDHGTAGSLISDSVISNQVQLISKITDIDFTNNFDFAILVGFHGMENSPGILPHTIRFDFKQICINNIPVGEVELFSRWLGAKGIPVILVTGDREAMYEANCYNPYRASCCVKSLLQENNAINPDLLYEKLSLNTVDALKLDKSLCISLDQDAISLEFYNPDMIHLIDESYTKQDEKVIFKNCTEFIYRMTDLAMAVSQFTKNIFESNIAFLKEVRTLAKHIKKEDAKNSEVGKLLNNNLVFIDEKSKSKILNILRELAQQ